MADPVYQDQPYMRKSFLFFSDVYLTGAVHWNISCGANVFILVFVKTANDLLAVLERRQARRKLHETAWRLTDAACRACIFASSPAL